jgi:hypothetical protein
MLRFLFNIDVKSANFGELRPVIIVEETIDGWVGQHALQGRDDVRAVRHASWSRSQWTAEDRPSNDRLHFLAITLRERAIATLTTYQQIKITQNEAHIIEQVIAFVDFSRRPNMTQATDNDITVYLNTMNELRSNLENVRFGLDIRHECGQSKQHGGSG